MSSYRSLALVIASIFLLLGIGAYFSPSYTAQMTYAQGFLLAGALLFIASVVVVVAAVGFHHFALYLGVLASMAIASMGLYAGFLVLALTYVVWGFVFGLELLLAFHQAPTAIAWFKTHYTYRVFYGEYRLFYPIIWCLYFLLEVVPRLVTRDRPVAFEPHKVITMMREILPA